MPECPEQDTRNPRNPLRASHRVLACPSANRPNNCRCYSGASSRGGEVSRRRGAGLRFCRERRRACSRVQRVTTPATTRGTRITRTSNTHSVVPTLVPRFSTGVSTDASPSAHLVHPRPVRNEHRSRPFGIQHAPDRDGFASRIATTKDSRGTKTVEGYETDTHWPSYRPSRLRHCLIVVKLRRRRWLDMEQDSTTAGVPEKTMWQPPPLAVERLHCLPPCPRSGLLPVDAWGLGARIWLAPSAAPLLPSCGGDLIPPRRR